MAPPFMSVNGCVRCIPTRVGPGKIRAALWHLSTFGIETKTFPKPLSSKMVPCQEVDKI